MRKLDGYFRWLKSRKYYLNETEKILDKVKLHSDYCRSIDETIDCLRTVNIVYQVD